MKAFVAMLLLIMALGLLSASLSFTYVATENHGTAVTRVVIGLYGEGQPKVSKLGNTLEVNSSNFESGSTARINFKPGGILSGVEQLGSTIVISAKQGFRHEQLMLSEPRRLVLDCFITNPDKTQRLTIADFYAETGKLNTADNAYAALHTDYREDTQILYNWALLLYKRESPRATQKLSLIPKNSAHYQQAQTLLAKIHGAEEPLPPLPPEPETTQITDAEKDSMAVRDTIITAPIVTPIIPEAAKVRIKLGFAPYLIGLSLLIALALIIYSFRLNKKPSRRADLDISITTSDTALDTKTMCRMVSKLLADGWTHREIARELKISHREVEHYTLLCHQGGHEDD